MDEEKKSQCVVNLAIMKSGCYQIANDKSPASLRGSVKKTQFKIMKTIIVIRMGLEPMTLTLKV